MNLHEEQKKVQQAMNAALSGLKEDPWLTQRIIANAKGEKPMAKKLSVSAILAIALLVVSITVALAVEWVSNIGQIYNTNDNAERQEMLNDIQQISGCYEGNAVRCTLTEALYDSASGTYGLGWTLEPLNEGDRLYVVLDGIAIGGERVSSRNERNATNYLLKQKTDGAVIGELPENSGGECEIAFSILRPTGEIVEVRKLDDEDDKDYEKRCREMLANGQLPMEGGELTYCYNGGYDRYMSYSDALLQTGLMEIADRFTLKVDISAMDVSEIRTYTGPESFVFDGYEILIHSCMVTPFTAKLEIEYITDNEPGNGGKGMGTLLSLKVNVPNTAVWSLNQGGVIEDPVQLADGRWSTMFTMDAMALQVFPEEFQITVGFYDDDFNLIVYDDIINIKLTDR